MDDKEAMDVILDELGLERFVKLSYEELQIRICGIQGIPLPRWLQKKDQGVPSLLDEFLRSKDPEYQQKLEEAKKKEEIEQFLRKERRRAERILRRKERRERREEETRLAAEERQREKDRIRQRIEELDCQIAERQVTLATRRRYAKIAAIVTLSLMLLLFVCIGIDGILRANSNASIESPVVLGAFVLLRAVCLTSLIAPVVGVVAMIVKSRLRRIQTQIKLRNKERTELMEIGVPPVRGNPFATNP